MLKSMTGFGRVEDASEDKVFLIEIKSLNGKQYELNLKLTPLLKPHEFAIRNILSEHLLRGSVECTISLKQTSGSGAITINKDIAKGYFMPLKEIARDLDIQVSEYVLAALLRLPDVVVPNTESLTDKGYRDFEKLLLRAIEAINAHRLNEGAALKADLLGRINRIVQLQEQLQLLAPLRQERMHQDLKKKITEQIGTEHMDLNRLEQEIIYYIEKIDISEEQVRLKNHCEYFLSILNDAEQTKGKKLGFVLQEIGREINTTGAKANDAEMQKLVVLMKDELEKAKEQVLNVL
jgi:uncharacterized protein (TIGR00255 family)